MGLDTVELVMDVEDAFGVSIPNESAATIRTVGDLHRTVLALHHQRPHDDTARCPSTVAFYKTRSALVRALGVERRAIRPETPLDDLFPKMSRAKRYKAWTRALGAWYAPELQFPKWVTLTIFTVPAGIGILAGLTVILCLDWRIKNVLAGLFLGISMAFIVWLGGVILLGLLTTWLGLCRHWPPTCRTVGDLSQAVLLANPGLVAPGPTMTDDFAWRMLVPIVSAQLGIPEDQIHPHSRFVEDLHAG